jgi:hypothetical protein
MLAYLVTKFEKDLDTLKVEQILLKPLWMRDMAAAIREVLDKS